MDRFKKRVILLSADNGNLMQNFHSGSIRKVAYHFLKDLDKVVIHAVVKSSYAYIMPTVIQMYSRSKQCHLDFLPAIGCMVTQNIKSTRAIQ
jgi:hypothetical protein